MSTETGFWIEAPGRASHMKFADKYEILEMVTSGRVSTFLARERTTQQPVVVYTFECAGTAASELNTASIIARFSSLAPNPPGVIVKAGFDEASASAFITTKMPESAALQEWVRGYQAFGKSGAAPPPAKPISGPPSDETAEISAAELRAYFAQNNPAQKQAKPAEPAWGTAEFAIDGEPASSQSGGEFTRLFRELNAFQPLRPSEAPAVPKSHTATDADLGQRLGGARLGGQEPTPPKPSAPASGESSPGAFTREFLGISSSPSDAAPSSTGAHDPTRKEPGSFTKEFLAASPPRSEKTAGKSSEAAPMASGPPSIFGAMFGSPPQNSGPASTSFEAPTPAQKEAAGEFTRFFQDPFEHPGEPARSTPIPDLESIAPPKQQQGDFTRVFGPGGVEPESPPPSQDPASAPGSFTQIFSDKSPAKGSQLGQSTLGTNPNLRPAFPEPAAAPPSEPSRPAMSATPVPPPIDPFFAQPSPRGAPVPDQPLLNRSASSTTDVFRPGTEGPPIEEAPSGPSEFTVFLNRSQLKAVLPPDVVLPSGRPSAGPPQGFAPPPIPNPFAPPPPPPMPAVAMPAVPAPPPVPKPVVPLGAPKPASFWPLITVLTILLAIGALLVMYFALKH